MEKKHLILFEDVVFDRITEEAHEKVHFAIQQMRQRDQIDFFINVPCERRYQFFVYMDESKTGMLELLKLFTQHQLFFRYKELI